MIDHQSDVAAVTVDSAADGPHNPSVKTADEKYAAHTPGPWHIANSQRDWSVECDEHGDYSWVSVSRGEQFLDPICLVIDGTSRGTVAKANARLIAAAPDLLDALVEIVDYGGGAENALSDEHVMERVLAAIAKATQS